MPKPTFQRRVEEFTNRHGMHQSIEHHVLDLAAEVGEIAKETLEATEYGKRDFSVADGWNIEVGDAFFSLICVANSTGVNLEKALADAMRKYEDRLRTTGSSSSRARVEDDDDDLP